MNKQFLSLLLLTSFVGTMSASAGVSALTTIVKPTSLSIWTPNFILVGAKSFGAKAAAFMGKAGAKFAGLSLTAQEAILTVPLVGAPIGMVAGVTAVNDHLAAKAAAKAAAEVVRLAAEAATAKTVTDAAAEVARLNARPFYTKAGQAISGYASNGLKAVTGYAVVAKSSVSNGVQAVVASAKLYPKSAIAVGVIGTAGVSYLAYKLYNRSSISLTEQEMPKLRLALVKATTLGKRVSGNPSVTTPVRLEQAFTTESTGLPKKAVDALNKHVALARKLSEIQYIFDHNNGRAAANYEHHLSIQQELKALDAQVLATFPSAAFAA